MKGLTSYAFLPLSYPLTLQSEKYLTTKSPLKCGPVLLTDCGKLEYYVAPVKSDFWKHDPRDSLNWLNRKILKELAELCCEWDYHPSFQT